MADNMKDRYIIDTHENREFLKKNAQSLLDFGRRFPSPGGGSYYLSDDGTHGRTETEKRG